MSKHCHVLIVDDEPDIVDDLVDFLGEKGFPCVGASSPTEARRLFLEDAQIGIVLVDFRMPGQDGLDLLRDLRELSGSRPFEAIMFTGHSDEENIISALRLGVADYQKKPIDPERLLESVRRVETRLEEQRRTSTVTQEMAKRLDALTASLAGFSQEIGALKTRVGPERPGHGVQPARRAAPREAFSANLTSRQCDVVQLIAQGLNNYQIACELGISENTVKLHVSQILRATGMHNRTQLALAVARWEGEHG